MYKEFSLITYVGGIATLPQCCDLTVVIDNNYRRISLKRNGVIHSHLNFEDIEEVSLHEKSSRSAGIAAVRAIIAGVLTGGIAFLTGAALEARKKNVLAIYISYKRNGKILDILLNAKRQTANLYASISSALATEEPVNFDRSRMTIRTEYPPVKLTTAEAVVWALFGIMVFILLKSCMSIK
jgi:hypothetical protein